MSRLLAQDVAALYDVETRVVGQAVKNNPDKFPEGYVFDLTKDEVKLLKSKFLTLDDPSGRGHYSKRGYKAFSEKGLYMLATILSSTFSSANSSTLFARSRRIANGELAHTNHPQFCGPLRPRP